MSSLRPEESSSVDLAAPHGRHRKGTHELPSDAVGSRVLGCRRVLSIVTAEYSVLETLLHLNTITLAGTCARWGGAPNALLFPTKKSK